MLTKENAQKYLNLALSTGGDFAELFEEKRFASNYSMMDGKIDTALAGITSGISVRIYRGLQSVYGYTNELHDQNLSKMIEKAAKGFDGERIKTAAAIEEISYEDAHPVLRHIQEVPAQNKLDLMKRASDAALAYDPLIKKAVISYLDQDQHVIIANSDGRFIQERRERTRLRISAVAMDGDLMETGAKGPGARMGFDFYDTIDVEGCAREAADIAVKMIHAKECPGGEMTVVIDNGFGGVIFHEACGHSLEATSVAKGNSVFSGKLGEKIASDLVTAVDDGTIPNGWGSNNIDDEGNFTQRNVLIEKGILKGYLVDTLNGRRMSMPSTSSSRRENYSYEPTSRMTNTFIENGTSTFEEIIAATKEGLYAKHLGGGSVNPASGDFNFAVSEAYLIKDGKITEPVKGATLVGNGSSILFNIDMIANNGSREQGMCGSRSGSIPTDVGQPTLRVSRMTVGGKGGKA